MRSRATTIPFGLRTPVLGLVPSGRTSHFLDEIAHPHWGFGVDSEFEHALLERTHDALARPADYVDAIVAAQRTLVDAVQGPLTRFLTEQVDFR